MAEQTLTSQYGREPLTVDALVPTAALQFVLGRVHVGESDKEIRRLVVEKIRKARLGGAEGYDRAMRRQTIEAALWIHADQLAEYQWVMGPH